MKSQLNSYKEGINFEFLQQYCIEMERYGFLNVENCLNVWERLPIVSDI